MDAVENVKNLKIRALKLAVMLLLTLFQIWLNNVVNTICVGSDMDCLPISEQVE